MNGTAKQAAWAEKIRDEYRKLVPQHETSPEAAKILDTVFACEDAAFWIFCKTMGRQRVRAVALAYNTRVGKLAKTGVDVDEILLADNVR